MLPEAETNASEARMADCDQSVEQKQRNAQAHKNREE